jgi:murein DD-endopeptidase MepM/ murein hydrolase activator NlpD
MKSSSNIKNAIILAIVSAAAVVIVFAVIMKGVRELDMAEMTTNPELKPVLLKAGVVPPYDAAFHLIRPIDIARVPLAARFDAPLGSAHGALTYDAQTFGTMNRLKGGVHLGNDLNGIGGNDTDLGDPVRAIADGRVIFSATAGSGWGKMLILAHVVPDTGRVIQSVYAHLEKIDVAVGMLVRRGSKIGTVGNASGIYKAHLHLELREGTSTNPAEGYFTATLNRQKPDLFTKDKRGAPSDVLSHALEPGEEPVGMRFE